MTLCHLQKVSRVYATPTDQMVAINEVDLEIKAGESLAIMGKSGSGKSTLLHLLGLLDPPTSGSYYFDGEKIKSLSDQALSHIRSKKIGFVFQAFHLIPQLTVLENVELPFAYQKGSKDVKERSIEALERVGLLDRLSHRPEELSGGQKQRVAIARALVTRPLLLLADEPTGNLDSKTGQEILELFQSLGERGMAMVVVTHDREIGGRFKRLLHMKDGRLDA